jgi:hypothetical protein
MKQVDSEKEERYMRKWGRFLEQLYANTGGADCTSLDLYQLIKEGNYDLPESVAQIMSQCPNIAAVRDAIYRIRNKRFEMSNDSDHYLTLRWKKCLDKDHKHCGRHVFYAEKVDVPAYALAQARAKFNQRQ